MTFRIITTVVTPASSHDLTTLDAVKDELPISGNGSDAILGRYISGASQAVEQYCNRVFVVETVSDQFLPNQPRQWPVSNHASVLQVARWPIVTITSVAVNGSALAGSGYLTDKAPGQLTRVDGDGRPISWHQCPTVVQYSAGFETIPADVEDAVIRMVTKRYSAKGRDATLKAENVPGIRDVQYWIATGNEAGNMTPDVVDLLDGYRAPVIA